ncbi:MAG: uracil-DNA glycosylase [Sporomusaceae bacterium]|nr:uracil-DNA glycosylase [Sporomusaceae bacterium]
MERGARISCHKCQFFKVTWDRQFPYACKAYGFKGRNLPSLEVLSASGIQCMHFQEKKAKKSEPEKKYPDYI